MIILTKILWTLFQPVNIIIYLIILGIILNFLKYKRIGIKVISSGVILFLICGLFPIGKFLSIPLENRFDNKISVKPYGIIVLGGSEKVLTSLSRNQISLNSSSERLIYFYILSKKYPESKLVFSGGGKFFNDINESDIARNLFEKLNMDIKKIVFENKSRNTYENAKYSYDLVKPDYDQQWVLITSALTMPRAIGTFRKIGWNVIPYSVDYSFNKKMNFFKLNKNFLSGLRSLNIVTYEWIGLIFYKMLNRIDNILPAL
ncbi:MAG: hypothetical protein CFH01_01101 [Alphaproteobacteria bacterium MarineAlpha2_Bin1]|nr:MAG: hypothetical protein CFH01_01101 [Alphaproteobacteria bacterium MarineAlpha2_Bin1]